MQNDKSAFTLMETLFATGNSHIFEKGETIIGNDEMPDGVYLVIEGHVKSYSISENGEECVLIIYGKGDIFPVSWAYLGGIEDSIFYQALDSTQTRCISRNWFLYIVRTFPKLNFATSMQLARQFQSFSRRVDNLEYRKSYERVAYLLLSLYRGFGIREGEKLLIDLPVTHELIASSVNLARETVSRQIEKLTQEHIIATSHNRIEIIDMSALVRKIAKI